MKGTKQALGILGIMICVVPIAWTVQSQLNFNGEQHPSTAVRQSMTDDEIIELIAGIVPQVLGEPNQQFLPPSGANPVIRPSPQQSFREAPDGAVSAIRRLPQIARQTHVSCFLQDCNGNVVSQIRMSRIGDQSYWMNYVSDGARADSVTFVVTPTFTGAPVERLVQMFRPHSGSNITTPLGIPHWYPNATQGEWALIVFNNLGDYAFEFFEVVP